MLEVAEQWETFGDISLQEVVLGFILQEKGSMFVEGQTASED